MPTLPDRPVHPYGHINTDPLTLTGRGIILRPLVLEDAAALAKLTDGTDVFRWYPDPVRDAADMVLWVETALADQRAGRALPFVILDRATGMPIGSTRFGNIDAAHRRVEIGWTWLAPTHQRTAANTEAKLLLLTHAFEVWHCVRVELKTDSNNAKSRAAIARIGGVEEGVFRNHMIRADGSFRHSVYFSITDHEWPDVKARLTGLLNR